MTLREAIKKNKLNDWVYIAMHNKNGVRFYGTFVGDKIRIEEYLDMEISEFRKFSTTSSIYVATFPNYNETLGLDSLRFYEAKRQKQLEARERREVMGQISKRKKRT